MGMLDNDGYSPRYRPPSEKADMLGWRALLYDRCPKCQGELQDKGEFIRCDDCDFKIGHARFCELKQELQDA